MIVGPPRGSGFVHPSEAMNINVVPNIVMDAPNIKPDESNKTAGRGSFRANSDPFAKRMSGRASYSVMLDENGNNEAVRISHT